MLRQLTILGPGLLGGSIGLAARQRKVAGKVAIWARRLAIFSLLVAVLAIGSEEARPLAGAQSSSEAFAAGSQAKRIPSQRKRSG